MKKSVKMVRIKLKASFVDNLPQNLLELYKQKSVPYDGTSFENLEKHKCIPDWNAWYEIRNDSEKLRLFLLEHTAFKEFYMTMSAEKYIDFDFENHQHQLHSIHDRFEVDVDYDFSMSDVNEQFESSHALLLKMLDKQSETMSRIGENMTTGQHFNNKCEAPVPDAFLFKVNQTMLVADACSDYLQQQIKDGWRILTICPQPNQRRPDYILGRIASDDEITKWAIRPTDL